MTCDFSIDDLERLLGRRFSTEQVDIITAPLAPMAVVAGAGSGKTATMVARVVWLVAQGLVTPEGVLGLTFTTKAADELAGRVRRALLALHAKGGLPRREAATESSTSADGEVEPSISTYHAFAGRLVRDHALRVGREPTARLLTPAMSWQLAARAVGTYAGPMDQVSRAESTVIKDVLSLAGDLSEHMVEQSDLRAFGDWLAEQQASARTLLAPAKGVLAVHAAREQVLNVVAAYDAAKRSRDLLDFGDVVALAAVIARECPEVVALERDRFPVVLLDEYQDTGSAQESLLAALFGGGHAVTAVGDPCQSIYGWRGASAGALRRFGARFADPAEQSEAGPSAYRNLSTTYRNGGRVLVLANEVSQPLRSEGLPVPALRPAAGREQDGRIRCALLADVDAEASWVAEQVIAAVAGRRWADAAVLCRKRSMFPRLRDAFQARGAPVEVVGLGGLLQVPEVADLVATLRVLDDPLADADLLRLLTGPRWRIGPRDLAALGGHARRLVRDQRARPADPLQAVALGIEEGQLGSLVDALDDLPGVGLSDEGHERLVRLRDELRALRRRLDQSLPDLVADVERTLGLDVEVAARITSTGPTAARADLDAFADATARFAADAAQDGGDHAGLTAFLAYLAAAEDEEHGLDLGAPSDEDTIKLMTVHAAKGLEWPVVAVPGLAGGTGAGASKVFPGKPRATSWLTSPQVLPFRLRGDREDLPVLRGLEKEDLDAFKEHLRQRDEREELRLAYVAFTRAEELLLCSGYHWGEPATILGPSVLLNQARQACERGAGQVDHWAEPPEDKPLPAVQEDGRWPVVEPPAHPEVRRVAARVRELSAQLAVAADPELSGQAAALVASWDQDLRSLHEEHLRRARRSDRAQLPAHLSVSALVELSRDPHAVARGLRRPLPQPPSSTARRGTAFHAWLEHEVFGRPQLLDPFELPGSADEDAPDDEQLRALQDAFRASAWWGRDPYEVEVPFEMHLGQLLVRGRMDAVFRDEDGDEVVDWKTGRVPEGEAATAAQVQLAAYRLAWHRLSGVPLEQVRAAFHYVQADVTVRPQELLDEDGLIALHEALPPA